MERSPTVTERERLGEVTAPSGVVLLVDMGLLNLWTHDAEPLMPEWAAPASTVEIANSARDLVVEGADAATVAKLLGRQPGRHLFDIPAAGVPELVEEVAAIARERSLDARLTTMPRRVPHRRRVDIALADGADAGVVSFHGIWAIAARVPAGARFGVWGTRVGKGTFADRWRSVDLEIDPALAPASSEVIGEVAVDMARLVFADADALGSWRHEESADGRADFLFWGRDAEAVARKVGAPALGEEGFGWRDLPVEEILPLGQKVEALRGPKRKFATDFRPHSDHWRMLERMRAAATGAATLDVGGASLCAFFTSWGDGLFPVLAERTDAGRLARLRIELGTDEGLQDDGA